MDFNEWEHATWKLLESRSPTEADRDYTHVEVRIVMQAALQTLIAELASGGNIHLAKLGRFQVLTRKSRLVTSNLAKKQETYRLGEHQVIQFRASTAMRCLLERDDIEE